VVFRKFSQKLSLIKPQSFLAGYRKLFEKKEVPKKGSDDAC
jgi:hypothetical protein